MELLELSATDFCCFSSFTLKLKKAGLVWITGRNKDTRSADNNGSGKSTIFKALTWALYGKTVDGEHGDGVIKDGATRATVCVLIGDRNSTYKVTRTRKAGSPMLKLSKDNTPVKLPKKELQARIDSLLGLDYQAFKNTVFYGQNDSSRFADPKTRDSERKGVLHKILGLGILKLCHEETRRRRLAQRKDLTAVETKIEAQKARIEEQNLDELRKEMKQFERIRQHELERIQREIDLVSDDIDENESNAMVEQIKALVLIKVKLAKKIYDWEEKRDLFNVPYMEDSEAETRNEIEKLNVESRKVKRERTILGSNAAVYSDQLSLLEGSNCPTCSSPIKKGAAKKHKKGMQEKLESFAEQIVAKSPIIKGIKKKISTQKKILEKIQTDLNEVNKLNNLINLCDKNIADIDRQIANLERQCAEQDKQDALRQRDLESFCAELKKTENEENPYVDLLKKALEKARLYIAQLKTLKKKRQKVVSDLANIEFWFKAFSNQGLPSFILDGVMPILSERTNHYLEVLTDGDITVDFSTQREKKTSKGEMCDEIVINWTIEGLENYIPSGGQLKKIEIACDLALMDLASTNTNVPDLLCLDEIFSGLDQTGVQRVLLLLQDLRRKCGSIFVISHDDRMSEIFERSIVVKKKNGESKLKVVG